MLQAISTHGFAILGGTQSARTKLPRSTSKRPFLHHFLESVLHLIMNNAPDKTIVKNNLLPISNNGKINTLIYSTFWNCLHLIMNNAPYKTIVKNNLLPISNNGNKYPNLDRHLSGHTCKAFSEVDSAVKNHFLLAESPLKHFLKHEIESLRKGSSDSSTRAPTRQFGTECSLESARQKKHHHQQASRSPVCFLIGKGSWEFLSLGVLER